MIYFGLRYVVLYRLWQFLKRAASLGRFCDDTTHYGPGRRMASIANL